jgi:hypothetical protein
LGYFATGAHNIILSTTQPYKDPTERGKKPHLPHYLSTGLNPTGSSPTSPNSSAAMALRASAPRGAHRRRSPVTPGVLQPQPPLVLLQPPPQSFLPAGTAMAAPRLSDRRASPGSSRPFAGRSGTAQVDRPCLVHPEVDLPTTSPSCLTSRGLARGSAPCGDAPRPFPPCGSA